MIENPERGAGDGLLPFFWFESSPAKFRLCFGAHRGMTLDNDSS